MSDAGSFRSNAVAARPTGLIAGTPAGVRVLGLDVPWPTLAGIGVAALAAVVYLLTSGFPAGRPDFFYLADAFLRGQTWLDHPLGGQDIVVIGNHYYVPFGPFPAILFMPLMLFVSPATAAQWEPVINSAIATFDVWLAWVLAGRLGVERLRDRFWVAVLLGFSTQIWWVTMRGGVWHTSHLVATALTLLCLIELAGRRRAALIGLLAGAAFLTRAPVALAIPCYALALTIGRSPWRPEDRSAIARDWVLLALGVAPSIAFFLWYNDVRFGSPLESGYALARLPDWLDARRAIGLFSLKHLPMNIDLFFLHMPAVMSSFPWIKPDGQGMSVFLTSPALLLGLAVNWRSRLAWIFAAAFVLVLIPNLLYYGGGWLQYGFRYALDAIPFAVALAALAARRIGISATWWAVLAFGVAVNSAAVYWVWHLT